MFNLRMVGPSENLDEAIDALLASGYDVGVLERDEGRSTLLAFGACAHTASTAVRELGWTMLGHAKSNVPQSGLIFADAA
jgi:hypothetical protein